MERALFMRRIRSNVGFTLIELLVVIAIIARLAAILFPVFARAREKARQATCQSNLKQLGLGLIQYCQDYDEYYPSGNFNSQISAPLSGGGTATAWGLSWGYQVFPYVKSTQIFDCPDNTYKGLYVPFSYGYNFSLGSWNGQGNSPVPLSRLTASSSTFMLFESSQSNTVDADPTQMNTSSIAGQGSWRMTNWGGTSIIGNVGLTNQLTMAGFLVHDPGANYLAADGHVKMLQPQQVSAGNGGYDAQYPDCVQGATVSNPPGDARCNATGNASGTEALSIKGTSPVALTFSAI